MCEEPGYMMSLMEDRGEESHPCHETGREKTNIHWEMQITATSGCYNFQILVPLSIKKGYLGRLLIIIVHCCWFLRLLVPQKGFCCAREQKKVV